MYITWIYSIINNGFIIIIFCEGKYYLYLWALYDHYFILCFGRGKSVLFLWALYFKVSWKFEKMRELGRLIRMKIRLTTRSLVRLILKDPQISEKRSRVNIKWGDSLIVVRLNLNSTRLLDNNVLLKKEVVWT